MACDIVISEAKHNDIGIYSFLNECQIYKACVFRGGQSLKQ